MTEPKPGYLTTEFWHTAIVHLIAVLAMLGIITPGVAGGSRQWVDIASVIAAAAAQGWYAYARARTKSAALTARALAPQPGVPPMRGRHEIGG